MDAKSGQVLYGKNEHKRMYPASITKIVTGIIALEEADPASLVTVSEEARNEEGTRVFLAEGELVTMEKLVYGLLVNSGNDAATAIAESIDGSEARFAERMNRFVEQKLELRDTHFTNPHGLPDEEHYTTAEDMAVIARYAMRNAQFRQIVATKTLPWTGEEWDSELMNHNRMLWDYEGANGVKNGYTNAAGFTLVTSAERGGHELIGVVMKTASSEEIYAYMTALLDYGFGDMALLERLSREADAAASAASDPIGPPQSPPPEAPAAAAQDLADNRVLSVPDIGSGSGASPFWTVMVAVFWFLQLVFMLLIGLAYRNKRRRSRRRAQSHHWIGSPRH